MIFATGPASVVGEPASATSMCVAMTRAPNERLRSSAVLRARSGFGEAAGDRLAEPLGAAGDDRPAAGQRDELGDGLARRSAMVMARLSPVLVANPRVSAAAAGQAESIIARMRARGWAALATGPERTARVIARLWMA